MASVNAITLFDGSTIATTTDGTKKTLEMGNVRFVGTLLISGRSAGTYDVKIQHSHDGENWDDLKTFTQATADTYETVQITENVLAHVRGVCTVSSGPGDAEVELKLNFDVER